jgi:hypothetical protein
MYELAICLANKLTNRAFRIIAAIVFSCSIFSGLNLVKFKGIVDELSLELS